MKESRYVFYCDSCYTEKNGVRKDLDPDSVKTCIYRQPFRCVKKEQWIKHLQTDKHIRNVANANNIKDELVNECKHCDVRLDDRSYKIHSERNYMLWASKGISYTKDCSCNNFILNGKRFNTFGALRDYHHIQETYSYGKDKKIDYRKKLYDQANKILEDKENHINQMLEARKRSEEKMRKEIAEKKEKEKKKKQEVQATPPIENLTLSIEDQEYNQLNNIKDTKQDKHDLNIKPIWDSEDMCCECGKHTNAWKEYPIEKLELWEEVICHCDSDSDSDSDDEKII